MLPRRAGKNVAVKATAARVTVTPTMSFGSIMSVARNMVWADHRVGERCADAKADGGERHSLAGHELYDVLPRGA